MARLASISFAAAATAALAALPVHAIDPLAADPAQLCVDLINQKRATLQLPPLARWREGEPLAASQAAEDGKTDTPHGAWRRRNAGGLLEVSAQNECNNTDPRAAPMIRTCIDDMWAEGPPRDDQREHGHYVTMASRSYTKVACGFAVAPDGRLWSAQDFITDPRASAPEPATPKPIDPVAFDRDCVTALNKLRAGEGLPAYRRWDGGSSCAGALAAIRAHGGQPTPADQACLGKHGWGLNECATNVITAGPALDGCLARGWAPDSPSRRYLASSRYQEAACGFARGGGAATIMQVFR